VVPGWGIVLAPIGLFLLMCLGFGLGLLLAPFSLLYHDLSRLLLLVTGFWLLVTPVAYSVPTGFGRLVAVVNPVSQPLLVTRDWLTGGALAPSPSFFVVALVAPVLVVAGWVLLRLSIPHLIDRFGS
jgi:lipopolysaccharide transport system permease protein